MTPKTNMIAKSANVNTDESNPFSSEKDPKKQTNDPRLKSILKLIETQLAPIQEVMIYYAKAILDKTCTVKSRQATLAKFRKTIPNNITTANNTSTPSSSFYIPKSARVKITLTYSNALKNETEIKDLEEELKESISIFGSRVACIFERTAKLEETQEKISRLKIFLTYCHKLIQGFIIIAKRRFDLETNLSTDTLELWSLLVLLRNFKKTNVSGLSIYEHFLETNYQEVKANFIKTFLPGYKTPEQGPNTTEDIFYLTGSEEEKNFVCEVVDQVEGLIIPTTFKLQLELDRQDETQTLTTLIAAKFKRDETINATEATALAIHNVSQTNQNNMEQHIKKLVDEAIKEKLLPKNTASPKTSSPTTPLPPNKQKNSNGSKKPLPSLPKNKRGTEKKDVSFRYPISDNDEENNEPQKKKQKNSQHHQSQSKPKPKTKNKYNRNGKGDHEDKKAETRNEA